MIHDGRLDDMISIFLGVLHLFRQLYDTPLMHTLRCAFGIAWWRSFWYGAWRLMGYGIMIFQRGVRRAYKREKDREAEQHGSMAE